MRKPNSPKNRRSPAERRKLLAELDASGLTLAAFSARTGIPTGTLSCWRHLERKAKTDAPPLVPIEVIASQDPVAELSSVDVITVETASGHRVLLPRDLDEATLSSVIRAIVSC